MSQLNTDPFLVDHHRSTLASADSRDLLLKSYLPGAYPELPDLSSESLWAELANYEATPDFRMKRLRQVVKRLPKKGKILDIGSGWGEIIPMIQEAPGREYVAMDFSKQMLERLSSKYPAVRTIFGGIDSTDEKFDVIMALEVCEHIPATKIMQFYESVRSKLSDGGQFIVTVPLYEDLKAQTLTCPQCNHMHNRMGHVRRYTPELIVRELELGGFEVLDLSFVFMHFDEKLTGVIKRVFLNAARSFFGFGKFMPLNAVVIAKGLT